MKRVSQQSAVMPPEPDSEAKQPSASVHNAPAAAKASPEAGNRGIWAYAYLATVGVVTLLWAMFLAWAAYWFFF